MPKTRTRSAPIWPRDSEPTPGGAAEWDRELAELWNDPAFPQISKAMMAARGLGFDPADPDIFARIVRSGRSDYALAQDRALIDADCHASSQERRQANRHRAIVYYMRLGELVKIGTTTNITERHNALSPQGIMALELGGREVEQARHAEFVEFHEHGEWFRLGPELGAHIVACRESFAVATGKAVEVWLNGRIPARRIG